MNTSIDKVTSSVCIVIPVHKTFDKLGEYEVLSLNQCFEILHKYPVFFAGPHSINWSGYEQFCQHHQTTFQGRTFDEHYFQSAEGYNKLLITPEFYNAFSSYEYMLLYQTDCFVFRDELELWCEKKYDYIGAPWLGINMNDWFAYPWYPRNLVWTRKILPDRFIHKVGNGGLSLRNIGGLTRNLKRFQRAAGSWPSHEDSFFCHYVGTYNPFFRIPDVRTALQFSFDAFPQTNYEMNGHRLPFGCHGWFRNEPPYYVDNLPFWEPFIQASKASKSEGRL